MPDRFPPIEERGAPNKLNPGQYRITNTGVPTVNLFGVYDSSWGEMRTQRPVTLATSGAPGDTIDVQRVPPETMAQIAASAGILTLTYIP